MKFGALMTLVLAGCEQGDGGERWTTRDSAGVEIVTTVGMPPLWPLDEQPEHPVIIWHASRN